MSIVHPPLPHQPFSDSRIHSSLDHQIPPLYNPAAAAMTHTPPLAHRHTAPLPESPKQTLTSMGPPDALSQPAPPAPRPGSTALPSLAPVARDRLLPDEFPPTPDLTQPSHRVLFPDAMVALAPPATEGPEEDLRGRLIECAPVRRPLVSLDHMVDEQIPSRPPSSTSTHSKSLMDPPPIIVSATKSRQSSVSPRPRTAQRSHTSGPGLSPVYKPQIHVLDTTSRSRHHSAVSGLPRPSPLSRDTRDARSTAMAKSYTDEAGSSPSSRMLSVPLGVTSPSSPESSGAGPREELEAKAVLIGDSNAGKTSLILRHTNREFQIGNATVGSSIHSSKSTYGGVRVKLQIWDTAGQEKFRSMTPLYYRESRVCIIVYDTTSRKSFEAVERWLRDVRNTVDPNTLIVIAGTKLDCVDRRVITSSEACATIKRWLRPPGAPITPPQKTTPSPPPVRKEPFVRSNSTASRHSPAPLKPITPPRSYSYDGLASMGVVATPVETATSITMTISPPPLTTAATDSSTVPPSSTASVPFPKSARTLSNASGSTSPPGSTHPPLRPRSPGPQLTSFPAYRHYERTPPTSALQPNFVIGESIHSPLGPNRPSHRTSAGRSSFSGWLGWAAGTEVKEETPTPALSTLARVAEDHQVSPRTESAPESPNLSAQRPTSHMGRNSTSPARFPHDPSPMLHVVHDANARRKSDEWSSRLGWGGLSPAEALNEFSEGVKKKQSGEMLTGTISTLPPRVTRSRGGSLGRDSRLYGEEPQPEPFWGVDVDGVRVGECSALTGEGVDNMFRTIGILLVQRKEKMDRAEMLRKKGSFRLTDNKGPEIQPRGYCCT